MNQLELLKTRRFFPLFLTQFLGAFNDNLFKNALVILITFQISKQIQLNTEILITIAAGLFILPFFIFSSIAGQLADKYEKSMLIRYTKIAEILLMVIACGAFYLNSISLFMLVLFLLGTQATFFGPLKYSILSEHLFDSELIAGNALIESGTFLSILLGTICGGIFASFSSGPIIICMLILVVAIAGYLISRKIPIAKAGVPTLRIKYHVLKESWSMVQQTFAKENICLIIICISWFWFIGATYLSQFPTYVKNILNAQSSIVTIFLALFTTGIGVGSACCNRLLKGKINATYVPIAALGMTIFAIDLVIASKHAEVARTDALLSAFQFLSHVNNLRILLDLFLLSVCGGIYIVPLYAMLQQKSNDEDRSRVIATNNILNSFFMVISSVTTSLILFLHFTITQVFLVTAIANLVVAIYICKLFPDALIKSILIWIVKTCYRAEIKGLENYYKAGDTALIIANHTSFIDAILIAALLPGPLSFAVDMKIAQKWWMKWASRLFNIYPMDPANPFATKSLIEYLRQKRHVVIFPEGRITVTGSLMKIYEGPGLIADKSGATLLPIRIDGAQYSPFSRMQGKLKLHWFPSITLTVLEPKQITVPKMVTGRARRKKLGSELYDLMTDMMFDSSNISETLFQSLINAKSIHGGKRIILEDIERKPLDFTHLIMGSLLLGRYIAKKSYSQEYIGILLPNSSANVITFFAMQFSHRIPAMLNFSAGILNILSACETAQIKQIYTSRKFIHHAKLSDMINMIIEKGISVIYLEDIFAKINLFQKIIVNGVSLISGFYYCYFNKITKTNRQHFAKLPAVLLFTSGSEGKPKGVVLTHENLQSNRFQLSSRIDFNPSDKIFNALPMFHSFGLNCATLLPIISGIYVFMYPSPLHYKIIPEICYDVNATILFGTDVFLNRYAKSSHPYDFYNIRYVFAGAEKLRVDTIQLWMEKLGIRIMEGYGATEASPVISTNTAMSYKKNTVGRLLPGIRHRLESIEGIENGYRLSISGPNIMMGYMFYDAPRVIVPPKDGWYDTGDIVSIDDEGYISIKGRAKRFAKIAGEMISLLAVEEAIYALWPQYKHAIISQPDDRKGEQLILFTNHLTADLATIIQYFKINKMADICLPKHIVTLTNIPELSSGKIDYQALKIHSSYC